MLEQREETKQAKLLVLTANRGLCGGYNGNLVRAGRSRWVEIQDQVPNSTLEISGKRGIGAFKFRGVVADTTYTHFEDKPTYEEVDVLASRYLEEYTLGSSTD